MIQAIRDQYTKKDSGYTSTRNACKLCSPLGASVVFRGIDNCVPLIHGSQGCSTYIRRYLISHFREPLDIASSNFTESSAIFGGSSNLKKALDNVIRQYRPEMIGVATTCLSETIGEDIRSILREYRIVSADPSVSIVHASTPSYAGTHMDGFHEAVRAVCDSLSEGGVVCDSINLIPSFLSAEDLRELAQILGDFGSAFTMLPDYSRTLDDESWEDYVSLSRGGTPLDSIRAMGRARATVTLGTTYADEKCAGALLHKRFGVDHHRLVIPLGIRNNDVFFETIEKISGKAIPEKYLRQRGRLVDAYIDGHKYLFGKRALIYGEEDLVVALASFLEETGVVPVLCASGGVSGRFKEAVNDACENSDPSCVREDTDFATMLDIAQSCKPDFVIGSSKGYYLSKNLGIPLVRVGFPVHDRIGAQRILHVGYRGTLALYDMVVNTILDERQRSVSIGYSYM